MRHPPDELSKTVILRSRRRRRISHRLEDTQSEILRFAQNDKRGAQNDSEQAQDDR